jgi:hypothetical protein
MESSHRRWSVIVIVIVVVTMTVSTSISVASSTIFSISLFTELTTAARSSAVVIMLVIVSRSRRKPLGVLREVHVLGAASSAVMAARSNITRISRVCL